LPSFWSLGEVRGVHHTGSLARREQQAAIPQVHPVLRPTLSKSSM
jgi:hypothetical protein